MADAVMEHAYTGRRHDVEAMIAPRSGPGPTTPFSHAAHVAASEGAALRPDGHVRVAANRSMLVAWAVVRHPGISPQDQVDKIVRPCRQTGPVSRRRWHPWPSACMHSRTPRNCR